MMSTTLRVTRWSKLGRLTMLAVIASSLVVMWFSLGLSIGRANHEGDGAIHTCANNTTGDLRLVTNPNQCRSFETNHDLQMAGLTPDVFVVNDAANPVPVTGQVDTQPSMATKFHTELYFSDSEGDEKNVYLPSTIDASLITATMGGDEASVRFLLNNELRLDVGTLFESNSGTYVIPLPQQVSLNKVEFYCGNLIEDCEVKVSIIGN